MIAYGHKYLNLSSTLISKPKNQSLSLEPNYYSYPFEFILPKYLPYSFKNSHYEIYYYLFGTIDRSWFCLA